MFKVAGKVAIVTGASKGIGKSGALLLAINGAKVVISSRNKYGDLDAATTEIRDEGGEVLPVQAHMGNKHNIENLVTAAMEKYGRIDILVNNAAINPIMSELVDLPEEAWDKIMDVNLKGCYLLANWWLSHDQAEKRDYHQYQLRWRLSAFLPFAGLLCQ